jgi:WD40 repeat protein
VRYESSDRFIFTSSKDNSIRITDTRDDASYKYDEVKKQPAPAWWQWQIVHNSSVFDIILDKDENFLFSGGDDSHILVYDIRNVRDRSKMRYHAYCIFENTCFNTQSLKFFGNSYLFIGGFSNLTVVRLDLFYQKVKKQDSDHQEIFQTEIQAQRHKTSRTDGNSYTLKLKSEDNIVKTYYDLARSSIVDICVHHTRDYLFAASTAGEIKVLSIRALNNPNQALTPKALTDAPYFTFPRFYDTCLMKMQLGNGDRLMIVLTNNNLLLLYSITDMNDLQENPIRIIDQLHPKSDILGFYLRDSNSMLWSYARDKSLRCTDFKEVMSRFISKNQVTKSNFNGFYS